MPEIFLDVSDLEPCEPLDRSLSAARNLLQGQFLRVRYQRRPNPLFPLLQQLGCLWQEVDSDDSKSVVLLIWRAEDTHVLAELESYKGH